MSLEQFDRLPSREAEEYILIIQLTMREEQAAKARQNASR